MFVKDLTDPKALLMAVEITVIVSADEGGILNGAFIGEILPITAYGFSRQLAFPTAVIVGALIDPMTTLLRANGDLDSAMMVTQISEEKKWLTEKSVA